MFKRTLMTAIATLGATMSFATMHSMGAIALAKPMLVAPPDSRLMITELLINPQGTDNGNEYFEITNTSDVQMDLADVYLIYIDCEVDQEGEVDLVVRLGDDGSGGIGGSGTRLIDAGDSIVFRDRVGTGNRAAISPEGDDVVQADFESFMSGQNIKNSCGMFALVTGVSGVSYQDNLDEETWSNGLFVNSNPDGILDFTQNNVNDDLWTNTLNVVDFLQAANEDTSTYYSDSDLPGSGYNQIQCEQQGTWTPDGVSLLYNETSGNWDNALIYDTQAKTNPGNEFLFVSTEYVFGITRAEGGPVTNQGNPKCTPGIISPDTGTYKVRAGTTGPIFRH